MNKNNLFNALSKDWRVRHKHLALVVGWFSYPDRKATFGDIRAKDVICDWLADEGIPFDVAGNQTNRVDGVDIYTINPRKYSIFIFVCGPWHFDQSILEKFQHCVKIGVGLSIAEEGNEGFDYIIPRDSPAENNPDLVFLAKTLIVPVVGIVLVHPQPMYGDKQRHHIVQVVIDNMINKGEIAPLRMDTLLVNNGAGLKHPSQFESLIRRTDVVISTRLHGMVFSLKNGVPVIAIDPIAGGAKITAQAKTLKWPLIIDSEDLTLENLSEAIALCVNGAMKTDVMLCRSNAEKAASNMKSKMQSILRKSKGGLPLTIEKDI